jgi:hypothetical protein
MMLHFLDEIEDSITDQFIAASLLCRVRSRTFLGMCEEYDRRTYDAECAVLILRGETPMSADPKWQDMKNLGHTYKRAAQVLSLGMRWNSGVRKTERTQMARRAFDAAEKYGSSVQKVLKGSVKLTSDNHSPDYSRSIYAEEQHWRVEEFRVRFERWRNAVAYPTPLIWSKFLQGPRS